MNRITDEKSHEQSRSDLAPYFRRVWDTCQPGRTERDYWPPDYSDYTHTSFLHDVYFHCQPAYLRTPRFNFIRNPFPLFQNLTTGFISYCRASISSTPFSYRAPRTFTPSHSLTTGRSPILAPVSSASPASFPLFCNNTPSHNHIRKNSPANFVHFFKIRTLLTYIHFSILHVSFGHAFIDLLTHYRTVISQAVKSRNFSFAGN